MKRKLHLEDLAVEAFETTPAASAADGTVAAFEQSPNCASGVDSCLGTCEDTCGLTCWDSCWCTRPDTCNCA